MNHTIILGESKVFVKRVPVTKIEYENQFSTKNLYNLPTYCNYGFGSTGFGIFRELVTNIKTTNWVLEGVIANFPLMYHYRIIPFSGQRADVDKSRLKDYVEYWGNSANAGKYMLDRAEANYELYVTSIVKYSSIITLMQDFFARMWGNNKKDTKFPNVEMQLLLKGTGFAE